MARKTTFTSTILLFLVVYLPKIQSAGMYVSSEYKNLNSAVKYSRQFLVQML